MADDQLRKNLALLKEKYEEMGQDVNSYLDGLLISNFLNYWEYIQLDTLLTLQKPKTDFPDESIFIIYHQITELYFRLCLNEIEQIGNNGKIINASGEDEGWQDKLDADFFLSRIERINRYFEALTRSFDVMVLGMDPEQFKRFRMALLPASGFQSGQYRFIELASTPLINLVKQEFKEELKNESLEKQYEKIYWQDGATEASSGKKTLTLKKFEAKYKDKFLEWISEYQDKNIWLKYKSLPQVDQRREDIIEALRKYDELINVYWPLVHYKSAVRYLREKGSGVPATGGTNWQEYLPPKFQKRIFFPDLWTEDEIAAWGKNWVKEQMDEVTI